MLLDSIKSPNDLYNLNIKEMTVLADEIRDFLIQSVHKTGGHLASNLGVVELTLALHKTFDFSEDRLIFDVSHQCYIHKILTGRKNQFDNLRQLNGISGFTDPEESKYDVVKVGHAGSSISTAVGLQKGFELLGEESKRTVVLIGDASISNGMSFEAMNHLGHSKKNVLIVLNDNQMSISKTVGALSTYLSKFISGSTYNNLKNDLRRFLSEIPIIGKQLNEKVEGMRKAVKKTIIPNLFEQLGIQYIGPVNGHKLEDLLPIMNNIKNIEGPILLHAITTKGKGHEDAEENPSHYHGISSQSKKSSGPTFTSVFGSAMENILSEKTDAVVITAAMTDGTGLKNVAKMFPERFIDVGISEEHAVAFAGSLSLTGIKPVVAIYSTFMQRSLDQLFQEISLQKKSAPVIVMDRGGLVGEDGPTHHGVFDIAYTRFLPRFIIMSPKDELELRNMLEYAIELENPVVIRFPKGGFIDTGKSSIIETGKAEVIIDNENADISIFAYGSLTGEAFQAIQNLKTDSVNLINLRFVKPLDEELILKYSKNSKTVITIEEHSLIGGVGEAVATLLIEEKVNCELIRLGLSDNYYTHASRKELLDIAGLSAVKIEEKLKSIL